MEEDEYFDPEESLDEDNETLDDFDPDDDPDLGDEDEELIDDEEEEGDEEHGGEEDEENAEEDRENDITSYRTTREIFESGRFSAEERRREYRRRGKSPSGVIDGEYNDMYLDEGEIYNDSQRDWDADA